MPRRPAPAPTSHSFASAPGVYGRKRSPNPRLPVLVGTAVLLTAGAVAFFFPRGDTQTSLAAEVPSVTGLSPAAAEKELREAKLTPKPRATPSAGTSAPDCRGDVVTGQWPGPGSNVNPGTAVEYAICPKVTVPKLEGLSEDDAKKALATAELRGTKGSNTKARCSPGSVGDQSPEDGVPADRGSKVTYRMCPPARQKDTHVPVPCIPVGSAQGDAKESVNDDGRFTAEIIRRNSPANTDTVTGQEPACGETAEPGSTIRLFVSDGPTPEPTDPTSTPPPSTVESEPATTTG
jgi:beta-lactam-binding protein with PASTA domain